VTIQHDDFCFKPISGKGCIITSAMQYWQANLTRLLDDPDIKETTKCIPPANATERVCFDQIGVPVMPFTILGRQRCVTPKENECSACGVKASALQSAFLLNNNDF
jgi:Niemann-Pick C1 protein